MAKLHTRNSVFPKFKRKLVTRESFERDFFHWLGVPQTSLSFGKRQSMTVLGPPKLQLRYLTPLFLPSFLSKPKVHSSLGQLLHKRTPAREETMLLFQSFSFLLFPQPTTGPSEAFYVFRSQTHFIIIITSHLYTAHLP